jgi:FMN phosphatase YigB (HAD superfamily)
MHISWSFFRSLFVKCLKLYDLYCFSRDLWYFLEVFMEREKYLSVLRQKLQPRGVSVVAWDLDDTLWNIKDCFERRITEVSELLSRFSSKNQEWFFKKIGMIIHGLEGEFNVRPVRMQLAVGLAAKWAGINNLPLVDGAIGITELVYQDTPKIFPGSFEAITDFGYVGLRNVGVSQANGGWTRLKMTRTGTVNYLPEYCCTDPNEPKGPDQWRWAFHKLGINPEDAMVIGDSYYKDILPAKEIGVRSTVLVLNGRTTICDIPGDVLVAQETRHIIDTIMASW